MVAEVLADGKTEVSVLLPRIQRQRIWHKLLHDRTADSLAAEIGDLEHANVTFVPYHLGRRHARDTSVRPIEPDEAPAVPVDRRDDGVTPISRAIASRSRWRARCTPSASSRGGIATMECRLRDASGEIGVVFLGRRHIAGIEPDSVVTVTGRSGCGAATSRS